MSTVSDKALLVEQKKALLRDLKEWERLWETGHWADGEELEARARKQATRVFAAARKAIRAVKP